jgi:hypothetical protein
VTEPIRVLNQRQCVKDAQAAGQTRELADWSALGTLGITWDASEALAAHQSDWYAVRAGETLAGYSVSVWAAGWDMSAARAGADPCGRKAEAHEIDEKLSPLNAPIERRNAMRPTRRNWSTTWEGRTISRATTFRSPTKYSAQIIRASSPAND